MKKIIIILAITLMLVLTGCGTKVKEYSSEEKELWDKFVVIEVRNDMLYGVLTIAYDKDTKVEYYITKMDGISPIYNADGTVKVYKEITNGTEIN